MRFATVFRHALLGLVRLVSFFQREPRTPVKTLTPEDARELEIENAIKHAARTGDTAELLAQPEGFVEQWARTQEFRISPRCRLIERLPWIYPVHPRAMAYFMELGWWTMETVEQHIPRRFAMAYQPFGGDEFKGFAVPEGFAKSHVHSPQEMAQWAVSFFSLGPSSALKATLMGHLLRCAGIDAWTRMIVPVCLPYIQEVELDVLLAVFGVDRPPAIALAASRELDLALRNIFPTREYDDYDPDGTLYPPYFMNAAYPHFGLEYMITSSEVRTQEELYRIGAFLKKTENAPVEYLQLPSEDAS